MTNTELGHHIDGPLRTDDQLRIALDDLLQEAIRPQLWIILLDHDDRLTDPLMPGDGYPDDPLEIVETADLGRVTSSELLSERLRSILAIVGAASAVLVWERPGVDELSVETRTWVREMALACRAAEVPLRAQLLLHDEGVRMLVPDDYV